MLLAQILWLGVFMTAPAVSTKQGHLQSNALPLSRLERLENLVADHQAQFQGERDQWKKEKQALTEALQHTQALTRTLTVALAKTEALTQSLAAENRGLTAELGDVQRQLASVNRQQQSLQDLMAKYATKHRPGCRVGRCEENGQTPAERPGSVGQTSSEHRRDSLKAKKNPKSKHTSDPHPVQLERASNTSSRHVHTVRSDDFGPLDVVVSHLAQQVTGLSADVQSLKTSSTQLLDARGSTFVQWGRSFCTGSSQLVYSGVLGGSMHSHSGAAANPLCLTLSPTLLNLKSGVTYNVIYGGEYETYDSHQDKDPVCAVCRSLHQTTIMLPGTNVCSAGWTKQYSGFLMAGYYGHPGATQFICVDSEMESEIGSQNNNNGHLLYYTMTQCGSLPCPPYDNNKVMTCAVCSK